MPLPFSAIREVFLDLDGTIYRGSTLFPTSGPFLEFLRRRGIGYAFLSNNSSCDPEELAERLTRLGIRSEAEEFYLSTDYAIDFLKREHPRGSIRKSGGFSRSGRHVWKEGLNGEDSESTGRIRRR